MQQSFGFDVLRCPRCGDRLELIALIEDPTVIRRILSHLGQPTDVPAARPAATAPYRPTGSVVRRGDIGALTPDTLLRRSHAR
jgi:hypothetical protein